MIRNFYRKDNTVYAYNCSECNTTWFSNESNFQWIGGQDFIRLGRYLGKPPVRSKILTPLTKGEDARLFYLLMKQLKSEGLERIKYHFLWEEEFDRLVKKYGLEDRKNLSYTGGCIVKH